jgi:hypothetical protein
MAARVVGERRARAAIIPNGYAAEVVNRQFLTLVARLLALGGEKVAPVPEPFLDRLVRDGKPVDGSGARLKKMRTSFCFSNSAALWNRLGYRLLTGWACSGGIWRRHAWCMDGDIVCETTVPRDAYFGIELSGEDALLAWLNNSEENAAVQLRDALNRGKFFSRKNE